MRSGPRPGAGSSSATAPLRMRKKRSASAPSRNSSSPRSTCSLRAQPAMRSRWRAGSPAKTGDAAMSSSSPCIGLPDRPRLLGEVDADGAPRDAAPAADAAGAAELVDPGGELVRHPLAIARARRAPNGAAVGVRVVDGEAGVPALMAVDAPAREVGRVLDGRAEAGGANHRAVAAGEAPLCDVVPARVLVVAVQELLEAVRVELAAHLGACARMRRVGTAPVIGGRLPVGHVAQDGG